MLTPQVYLHKSRAYMLAKSPHKYNRLMYLR